MHLAREPNAKSGCSDFRNSPLPSSGTRPKYQTCQNRVRSDLAVPAEKRSYVLSARITQESETQGRRNLGAAISGYEFRRQKSRERHAYRTCPGVPKDKDASREADRLGLSVRINGAPAVAPRVSF